MDSKIFWDKARAEALKYDNRIPPGASPQEMQPTLINMLKSRNGVYSVIRIVLGRHTLDWEKIEEDIPEVFNQKISAKKRLNILWKYKEKVGY